MLDSIVNLCYASIVMYGTFYIYKDYLHQLEIVKLNNENLKIIIDNIKIINDITNANKKINDQRELNE